MSNYSQWQTRHVLLHVLGNIDCKRHHTPHQDSFFVFQCYTGSTETFINVISNTTARAMPLITVFANSLHQAYPFKNQRPVTNARYYDNIARSNNTSSPWTSFGSSKRRNENKPTTNLTLTFPVSLSALISKNTVIFCAEPTFQLSEACGTKKNTKKPTAKLIEPFVYLYQLLFRKIFFRT